MPITYDYAIMEKVVNEILNEMKTSDNEEDVKFIFAHIYRSRVLDYLGIPLEKYEVRTGLGQRMDAVYVGKVIVEYERPNVFTKRSEYNESTAQVKRYIMAVAQTADHYADYTGISFDGFTIGWIHYETEDNKWLISEPIPINKFTMAMITQKILEG